jgi:D-glycero-alpha-D-manno-heptose-7-phosphate kinase
MGKDITKFDLMKKAVYIEQTVLRERVGIQDQTHAAFGGLNHYTFQGDNFSIHPVRMQTDCREALNESLCLIYTGMQRSASTVLEEQIRNTDESRVSRELSHMVTLCTEGVKVLEGNRPDAMLKDMGALLSEGWATKRKLSTTISNGSIDETYQAGMAAGAYGGKLCGAGAGGFFLFLANKDTQKKLRELFGENNFIRIGTVDDGAMIIRTGQVGELHG